MNGEVTEKGKYVYCIIPYNSERWSFGNVGIGNTEVYTMPFKDVAAVISDSPLQDYTLREDYVKTHENVIRQVMENHTVVPMAFGMVFADEETLSSVLERAYEPIKRAIELLKNRIELGVKVILPKDIVDSFDDEKRRQCALDVFESLSKKAVQFVNGELFSERLILNASFLVDKANMDDFSEEVGRLEEKYGELKFQYTGPWAPYSFVEIDIGKEGEKDVYTR